MPNSEKLWPHATEGAPLGEIEFAGKGKMVTATCIVAREYGAPAGVKPIEWRLLTNRVAASVRQITMQVDHFG